MQQKIVIPNKQGEKLVGVLHDSGSRKLAVVCHGVQCTKETNIIVNLAAAVENEGLSAFRFDFAGNGESEGESGGDTFSAERDDLRAVIEYFTGLNRETVVVLGHSKGGSVVLLYASEYHDIGAVVNVSGRYDLNRGVDENFMERLKKDGYIDVLTKTGAVSYRVMEKSILERVNPNMHDACLSIDKNCRVLTVHGSADEVNPVDDALEFAKIIPNHELRIVEGADHMYTSHQVELASIVSRFVKERVLA